MAGYFRRWQGMPSHIEIHHHSLYAIIVHASHVFFYAVPVAKVSYLRAQNAEDRAVATIRVTEKLLSGFRVYVSRRSIPA
jgi:hypothetical protein